jgi:isopenicillin N synthase-like dioxygenase
VVSNFFSQISVSASEHDYLGVKHHTDAGALMILLQDVQPALEVFRDGRWHLVEPLADALVVNIGDVVEVWSNDRYAKSGPVRC